VDQKNNLTQKFFSVINFYYKIIVIPTLII
jgi:hypothetical protein